MASERARLLRRQPTRPEEILWRCLRGSRFHGRSSGGRFRSTGSWSTSTATRPSSPSTPGLRSGGDGKQHEGFADYDAERTKVLESRGIRIIRFANAEVEGDLDSVLMRIGEALRLPFE